MALGATPPESPSCDYERRPLCVKVVLPDCPVQKCNENPIMGGGFLQWKPHKTRGWPASSFNKRMAHCATTTDSNSVRGLRETARRCIEERDINAKVARVTAMASRWRSGDLTLEPDPQSPPKGNTECEPGFPVGLELTMPTRVKRRGFASEAGKIAFVHAIAHIEWNAINLACDAIWRFGGMPRDYYDDWTLVAGEEAYHFSMLRERLLELGSEYGQLPAHGGLWETAEATRHDLLARMALVPRVLEARGLDVTPALIAKLRQVRDETTASILDIVLRDEVGHVRIGSRWFHHLCKEQNRQPAEAFEAAISRYFRGRSKEIVDPVARGLRLEAGFREDELEALKRLSERGPT